MRNIAYTTSYALALLRETLGMDALAKKTPLFVGGSAVRLCRQYVMTT